jgi:hypothetical protein
MFTSFEERGRVFKSEVLKVLEERSRQVGSTAG